MGTQRIQARTPRNRVRREPSRLRSDREIEAAIALVARGTAATVRLAGFPGAERLAARAAPHASAAHVGLRIERHEAARAVVIVGPIERDGQSPAR